MNTRLRTTLLRAPRRLAQETDGVAAVEFAFILPVLLLVYIGTCAVTSAVSASRAAVVLARTLTDLVSEQQANVPLTDTSMGNIFSAATTVMAPFPTTSLKMTLSNVEFVADPTAVTSNGYDAKTRWTVSFSGGTLRPCASNPLLTPVPNGTTPSPSTMPVGLYTAGFVIVADLTYVYTPSFGYFTYGTGGQVSGSTFAFTMNRTTYMRPRQTDNIRYTSGQTATICPIASPQTS